VGGIGGADTLTRTHAIMKRQTALLAACALALFGADAAHAGERERIGTLPQGRYECGFPGDAAGQAWVVDPAYNFTISSASRYISAKGKGTYLMTGQDVIFTRGPMKDMRMRRQASGLLQQVDAQGEPGRLRCHRVGS
jgi:hypothetical protein